MDKQEAIATAVEEEPSGVSQNQSPITRPSLAGSIAWRAVADWSSQVVSWVSLLVVVRLLAPSDFGMVAMCVVLYAQLRFVGEFGIPVTVVTLRDLSDHEMAELNTLGLLFGVAAFALGCALAWPLALFFRTPRLAPVVVVTSLALLALGLRSVPEGLLSKEMRFNSLSLFNAIRDIAAAFVTLALALLGFGYWALVFGNLLSVILRSAIILRVRPYRFAWPRLGSVRRPLKFSWHVLVSTYAWSTYNSLDNVTAGRVLGQAAVGLYGMAWNLANMPLEKVVSLVTTIIPSYLASAQKDPQALRRYLRSLTEALALVIFPVSVGLALVARDAVPLVLGPKWNGMIVPLQVLCVYAAFRSVVALLPKLLTSVGNARFVMRIELSALILMPIAFYIGSHWGIGGIAFGWVVAYPIVAAPLYWKTLKTIEMTVVEYVGALRPALDGAIAMGIVVGALKWTALSGRPLLLRLMAEIFAGGIAYVGTVLVLHRERALKFASLAKSIRKPGRSSEAQAG